MRCRRSRRVQQPLASIYKCCDSPKTYCDVVGHLSRSGMTLMQPNRPQIDSKIDLLTSRASTRNVAAEVNSF